MATIKVKLRQSSVAGRAGTIFYQLIHKKNIKQITTELDCILMNGMRSERWLQQLPLTEK